MNRDAQSGDHMVAQSINCTCPAAQEKYMEINQAVWCKKRGWRVLGLCPHNFLLTDGFTA